MIEFRFEIKNPWSQNRFINLGHCHGSVTVNKSWELEHTFCDSLLLDFCLSCTSQQSHAGLEISLGILGYGIGFRITDNRHWNYEQNCWESGK